MSQCARWLSQRLGRLADAPYAPAHISPLAPCRMLKKHSPYIRLYGRYSACRRFLPGRCSQALRHAMLYRYLGMRVVGRRACGLVHTWPPSRADHHACSCFYAIILTKIHRIQYVVPWALRLHNVIAIYRQMLPAVCWQDLALCRLQARHPCLSSTIQPRTIPNLLRLTFNYLLCILLYVAGSRPCRTRCRTPPP